MVEKIKNRDVMEHTSFVKRYSGALLVAFFYYAVTLGILSVHLPLDFSPGKSDYKFISWMIWVVIVILIPVITWAIYTYRNSHDYPKT